MGLPPGEVALHEVMAWAQEQTPFLPHASQRFVLWYLCVNAFRYEDNPEGRHVGCVLSAYAPVARICAGTGLSERAVRGALRYLQDNGYVHAEHVPGNGKSSIAVYWTEGADERRADFRAGIRPLPKGFQRDVRTPRKAHHLAVVTNLPLRQPLPER